MIHENAVDSFSEHLNSIDQHIRFTNNTTSKIYNRRYRRASKREENLCINAIHQDISERLQRAFKSHDVTLIHKPVNSLRSQLVRVKDTTVNLKKCGTVYQIHCEKCNKERSTLAKRPALWKSE